MKFSLNLPGKEALPSPEIFSEFQSHLGWKFSALNSNWINAANIRTEKGIPSLTLIQKSNQQIRLRIFESKWPVNSLKEKQIATALSYLFKVDTDSSNPFPNKANPFDLTLIHFYKSLRESAKHFGRAMISESGMIYVDIESKLPINNPGIFLDIHAEFNSKNYPEKPKTIAEKFGKNRSEILDSCQKSFQGAIENTLGLKAVEDSNWTLALKYFQTAMGLDSIRADYLMNCAAIYQVRKDNLGGIDFLSNYPELVAKSSELSGIMGALYEDLGRFQEAKAWALKALELEPTNLEWLINLSDALWGLGERVHSKNVLLHSYSEKPSFRLSIYLASTLLGLEEYENARLVLEGAHRDSLPSALSTEYYLRALSGLKSYEKGLEFIGGMGGNFPVSSNNFLFKGICEFNLKLYRLAAASAKSALDIDPTNREAQQLSTQISALIGSRSNLILRTPLSPLKTNGSLSQAKKLLAKNENQKIAKGSPITLLTQNIAYTWAPKTRWKKTRHQFFYIHDARKLIRLSELTYEINPGYSRFYVNAFRLYNAKMQLVLEEKASDFYVTKSHNTTLHPENLLVHLPIKASPSTEFLEVMTTEEAQLVGNEFPYLRYDNAYPFPILQCQFEIIHPPKHLLVSPFGQAKVDSLPDRLVVKMDEPENGFEDDFRPANDEFGTGFSATPLMTWKEVGQNYLKILAHSGIQLDSIPVRVKERSQEMIEQNRGQNPVFSVYKYVRDSVRYNNFEFSLQALVPDKSETVLSNGYSDCKGHALMLMQMLKARSLDAHLALVSLNHAGDLDQPSLHQFNHMIVQVPAQNGWPEYFLDATEKQSAFRRAPLGLEGKNVLIIDGENSRIATIPEIDSAGEHRVQVFHNLRVDAAQNAFGTDSMVLTGKVASEFRSHMQAWKTSTKYENLLSWLAQSYPNFVDERFRVMNEQDPDAPLIMVFKYRRKFPFLEPPQEFEHFPKLELSFLRFPKAMTRKAPIYFPHEIQIQSEWTYQIPEGYGWKSLNLDREISEHYLHWLLSIKQDTPESIMIKQNWHIDPFVATPEEYGKIQAEWDPILARAGLKLVISKPEPK